MKVRRRKYKTEQEVPSYWPSFVDIMTTVTLVFFFILLTSIGISSIFVDNIAVERETVYDKIQGELNQYAVNEEVMNFNREEGKIDIKTETFFDSDSSVLKEDGKKLASELGDIFFKLLSNEDIKEKIDYIEIVGHTDFAGSTIHGRELSTERAISFLNEMMPEDSELENLHGEKFKASGMSEFENYASKEERDRGYDEYNIEETKKDRRIEVRMVFSNEDLEKARVLKLQNQREIKSAREEGKTIVSQYKSKADSIYKEIVEDARKEASIIIEKSKVEIDRERNKAEDDIKNQVVDLAMTISEKVLGESIDMNKHKELIDEYISKVGM